MKDRRPRASTNKINYIPTKLGQNSLERVISLPVA